MISGRCSVPSVCLQKNHISCTCGKSPNRSHASTTWSLHMSVTWPRRSDNTALGAGIKRRIFHISFSWFVVLVDIVRLSDRVCMSLNLVWVPVFISSVDSDIIQGPGFSMSSTDRWFEPPARPVHMSKCPFGPQLCRTSSSLSSVCVCVCV